MINKSNIEIKKNILFFLRHENDLDFLLPLILNCKNKKIIFWKNINKNDFRVKYITELQNQDVYFLRYFQNNFFVSLLPSYLKFVSKKLSNYLNKLLMTLQLLSLDKSIQKIAKKIKFNNYDIIAFDHTDHFLVKSIIKHVRKYNNKIVTVSLPHGTNPFKNHITNFNLISFERTNLKFYDYVFCSDEQQYKILENDNKIILPTLRYTKEYIDYFISNILNTNTKKVENKNYIKIFYIHSKIFGNINSLEISRLFKILNKYNNFIITIKKHPRGSYRELRKLFDIHKYEVSEEHPIKNIINSDYVLCVQSISIIDALILKKPVIVPTYFSSSVFDEDILKHCIVINNPDELIECIDNLSNNKSQNYENNFFSGEFKEILNQWKKELEKI